MKNFDLRFKDFIAHLLVFFVFASGAYYFKLKVVTYIIVLNLDAIIIFTQI